MILFCVVKHIYMLNNAHWTLVQCRSVGRKIRKRKIHIKFLLFIFLNHHRSIEISCVYIYSLMNYFVLKSNVFGLSTKLSNCSWVNEIKNETEIQRLKFLLNWNETETEICWPIKSVFVDTHTNCGCHITYVICSLQWNKRRAYTQTMYYLYK